MSIRGFRRCRYPIRGCVAAALLFCSMILGQPLWASSISLMPPQLDSPPWWRSLVIYEVAPKAFTSPNGPESGNFASLKAKLPYLQKLGITAIWLAGYSVSDPHHFYNIWTQYADIEPDKFDPSLGTAQQFKDLVQAAHRKGIRVFLDVIDHGVMADSPLVQENPRWFRGGSWGMVDYDWNGGHIGLDEWWVLIWTRMVTLYGVDGFRLDTGTVRPDLWARIRHNAESAGHPIVIFEEDSDAIPGVTDFSQQDNVLYERKITGIDLGRFHPKVVRTYLNPMLRDDMPGYYARKFGKAGNYTVKIVYEDGSESRGSIDTRGTIQVRLGGLTADRVSHRITDITPTPDGIPDVQLTVTGIADRPIQSVTVHDDEGLEWSTTGSWDVGNMAVARTANTADLYLATLSHGSAILLSCHDNGWEGFPPKGSPYIAQGSRATFGYSFLFTPMIPIFMSGEEFDATFHALPDLSPNLFGGSEPGKGHWLYGSMLDWNEIQERRHLEMLDDVEKMIAIRHANIGILGPVRGDIFPNLITVPQRSDIPIPVPYMRWAGPIGIVVMANRNTVTDAHITLRIPVRMLGTRGGRYRVTDLWRGGPPKIYPGRALASFPYIVPPDKTPRGGVGLLKVERIP